MITLPEIVKAQERDYNPYRVTVIITCYNQEKYIEKALDSVLSQKTSFPYKLIVGDDLSQDGSRDILKRYEKKYPDKMQVLYQEKNLGVMPNRNAVLRICDTPYVAFLDGDDYWCDDEQMERKYLFLKNHLEYMGYFSAGGRENDLLSNDFVTRKIESDFTKHLALQNAYPGMSGGFFIRNMYKYMGQKDLDAYMGYALDETSKMPIFAALIGDIYRGDTKTSWVYRQIEGSLSCQESITWGCDGYFASRMSMMKMVKEFFGMDMQIEEQLEELVYDAFVTYVKKPNSGNKQQYQNIRKQGYYTDGQIRKIVVHRLWSRLKKAARITVGKSGSESI